MLSVEMHRNWDLEGQNSDLKEEKRILELRIQSLEEEIRSLRKGGERGSCDAGDDSSGDSDEDGGEGGGGNDSDDGGGGDDEKDCSGDIGGDIPELPPEFDFGSFDENAVDEYLRDVKISKGNGASPSLEGSGGSSIGNTSDSDDNGAKEEEVEEEEEAVVGHRDDDGDDDNAVVGQQDDGRDTRGAEQTHTDESVNSEPVTAQPVAEAFEFPPRMVSEGAAKTQKTAALSAPKSELRTARFKPTLSAVSCLVVIVAALLGFSARFTPSTSVPSSLMLMVSLRPRQLLVDTAASAFAAKPWRKQPLNSAISLPSAAHRLPPPTAIEEVHPSSRDKDSALQVLEGIPLDEARWESNTKIEGVSKSTSGGMNQDLVDVGAKPSFLFQKDGGNFKIEVNAGKHSGKQLAKSVKKHIKRNFRKKLLKLVT